MESVRGVRNSRHERNRVWETVIIISTVVVLPQRSWTIHRSRTKDTGPTRSDGYPSISMSPHHLPRLLSTCCTELRPSLSKDVDLSCCLGRVVDSFTTGDEARTRRMFDINTIKSMYSYCLCMYSSVQVSHSSLDTPSYPSVISRGGGGGCPQTSENSPLPVSLPCNQKSLSPKIFLEIKYPRIGLYN